MAQDKESKESRSAKLVSARELYQQVARKYGIEVAPLGTHAPAEKSG
jgi:hypothetical protein